jgi:hypothetical protein
MGTRLRLQVAVLLAVDEAGVYITRSADAAKRADRLRNALVPRDRAKALRAARTLQSAPTDCATP